MAGFDPVDNLQDRRIFYEVTGLRLDEEDFRGELTSEDEDEDENDERGETDSHDEGGISPA